MQSRVKTAIEFLKDGQGYTLGDIRLNINESGEVEIAGWSHFINIENLTKANSLRELNEIKSLFFKMIDSSSELSNFMEGRIVIYRLYYDDNGKASINICSEKNGALKWELSFK
jgi:hypothetical protein